ncbi:hypothetical protein [Streptomyces malaysiensis]|uniref:hypothetical protein n=1 Tax=Streptomyces malaysiensis TaxID=92644 RepID=UPI00114CA74D|nr:hypothetical protein [Streptomyces sp. SPMA113]
MHAHESAPDKDESKAPKPQSERREEQRTQQPAGRGAMLNARSVQRLQRGAGNAAVSRLLAAQRPPSSPSRQGPPGGVGSPAGSAGSAGMPGPASQVEQAGQTGQAGYAGQASTGAAAPHSATPRSGVPRAASPPWANQSAANPPSVNSPSIRRATDGEKPGRPQRDSPPASASALPERLPKGGAAAATATVDAHQGELQETRTRERPAVSLLKEHREAQEQQGEGGGESGRGKRKERGGGQGDRDHDHDQRGGPSPHSPGRAAQDDAAGAGHSDGNGSEVDFVDLDLEPLLPPLWGQSPQQHEAEVQDYEQGLAQDRGVAKEKVAAFTESRRARSTELAALAPQLTQQVQAAKAAALAKIGSAETSSVARVQAAVLGARSRIQAQAQTARGQVTAGHSAAVAAMGSAASGARTAMDGGFRTAGEAVAGRQDNQITKLGELYGHTEQRIRDAAKHAGELAVGEGKKRAAQYRSKMIHRDDNFWDGPLTDNRCKAQANAATAVGDAYKDELPKAADDPIADMKKGKPDAEKAIGKVAEDVRKSLETVLKQSQEGLADGHKQSLQGADDAKAGALASIGQALSSAEASLAQLQSSQIAAVRAQAAQQRQAVERNAAGATAAIGKGVATARGGLERSLREFGQILGRDAVPDPEQLEEVLRDTGVQFDERLEGVAERLRTQAAGAGKSLAAAAEGAAQGMAKTAGSAAESAGQTATSAGEALSRTASQTVSGLRQVQQSFAETAKTMQKGCEDSNKQVLEGLDKAYTELAGKFKEGADGQVKAVAEALNKAATGTGDKEIHPKITEEADKARDKVKPRWHTVLTFIVVIVVVIALTIALGPLVIGAVTAGAAALGAGAAAATIGTIVGGAIVGAAAGAVGAVVSNVMNGAPVLEGVGKAALFGAIGGAVGGGASAAVGKTALSTGARVAVEMAVEVTVEVGLEAADAAISGQDYSWQQALLTAATTVAVTGVMAHPRVHALTGRVQVGTENLLGKIGIKVPPPPGEVEGPKTPDAPDAPGTPQVDVPSPEAPSTPKTRDASGPSPDGTPGGTPQPGRGPDGATSWDGSRIDPTGGQGSADGPVRPRDQDGVEAELRNALGSLGDHVDVRIDPELPGRAVRVHYDIDDNGLISNVRMAAGPSATPTDIQLHAPTARTMMRYGGLSGRVRQLLRQVGEWVGVHGSPPVGSRAWEARLELRKLPDIITDRARAYADAEPAARAELESELGSLIQQFKTHADTLKEWNLDPGRGYVAAERPEVTAAKNRLPEEETAGLPDKGHFRLASDDVLEYRMNNDKSVVKRWNLDEDPPVELPKGQSKPAERFDPDTTREQAFEDLGGNDPSKPFGRFIKVLKRYGLFTDVDTFVNGQDGFRPMQDPSGLTHRTVRSNVKEDYVAALAEKLTHKQMLDASKELHSGDQGSLGEAWYALRYAQNADPQVTITPKKAKELGFELSTERRIDLVDGDTVREIKNISEADEVKLKGQLKDLVNTLNNDIPVGDDLRTVRRVVYSMLDPKGFRANSGWLLNFLAEYSGINLEIEVFNASGERVTIGASSGLDFSKGVGSLRPEGCNGKTLSEWLGN